MAKPFALKWRTSLAEHQSQQSLLVEISLEAATMVPREALSNSMAVENWTLCSVPLVLSKYNTMVEHSC